MSSSSGRTEHLYGPGGVDMGNFNGGNGTWYEEYVQFDGRVLWYFSGGVSRYFHVNALGSLGLATDQTGAPVEEMLYYPFGSRWQNSTGFGWDEKFAQFPQRNDDIQKYQASFREYDPGLGRWMSPDRLAGNVMNPQSLDRYTYVLNNPLANIDPLGLSCIHTDDGTTADNGDGKGCSEMNNNPQQVNVSGDGSGSVDTSSLGLLASLGYAWGVSGGAHIYAGGGGGAHIYSARPAKPKQPPWVCGPLGVLGNSLEFTTKVGLEAETPLFKVGTALFKNNTTGETGNETSINTIIFGGEISRVNPPGTPINSDAGSLHIKVHLFEAQYDFATHEWSTVPLSKFLNLGLVTLGGGSVELNAKKFKQQLKDCGYGS